MKIKYLFLYCLILTAFIAFAQKAPYLNYKGITDLSLAKQEWVKDNPEAYESFFPNTNSGKPKGFIESVIAPSNDLIANAIAINCGDVVFGSTEFATNTDNPGSNCGAGASPGIGV
jgi:hypothetical protein